MQPNVQQEEAQSNEQEAAGRVWGCGPTPRTTCTTVAGLNAETDWTGYESGLSTLGQALHDRNASKALVQEQTIHVDTQDSHTTQQGIQYRDDGIS